MSVRVVKIDPNFWAVIDEDNRILDMEATPMPLVANILSNAPGDVTITIGISNEPIFQRLSNFIERNRDDLMIVMMVAAVALGLFVLIYKLS